MARHWRERYPGVDIVLIEPEPDDELMFETNIMDYTSRIDVARHGFQSVTVKLAEDYDELREVYRRHGIEISATRVRDRKSTRLNSSHANISYAVFCLKQMHCALG